MTPAGTSAARLRAGRPASGCVLRLVVLLFGLSIGLALPAQISLKSGDAPPAPPPSGVPYYELAGLRIAKPLYLYENRLYGHLHIPGRRDVDVVFPRFLYAGPTPPYEPEVAWQRGILLPGWGQLYTRSYWKMPLLYAGYAAVGYAYYDRNREYKNFQRAYRIRIWTDQRLPVSDADRAFFFSDELYFNAPADGLLRRRDEMRRQRDYVVIGIAGWHLLGVVEAYVAAHLKGFDVSNELSLRIGPAAGPAWAGAGLTLQWGKGRR